MREGFRELRNSNSQLLCVANDGTGEVETQGPHKSSYRRKTTAYNVVWCCATFNTKGKKYCASKVIPETTLQGAAAEVLGLQLFDEDVFESQIDHIEACPGNLLRFVFVSGAVQEYRWKDRSRRDSWTTEMRETARQKALERSRADG